MKSKKIIIMLIISLLLIFQVSTVQAALQSNTNTPTQKNRDTWMTEIRKMEALGGTLGLAEDQNADLTFKNESNELDIHMQKNTEYGAMALLSASSYGNPVKIENGNTTTGNATGVVIPYTAEWTAAQYTDYLGETNYANRYINKYNIRTEITQKSGDALLETKGWHESKYIYYYGQDLGKGNAYLVNYAKSGGLIRNCLNSGIFSFANDDWAERGTGVGTGNANINKLYTSRAVIINGEGI